MSMADRLRHAREAAGYKTATAAVEHFNWPSSTYRAHENGQNNYTPAIAEKYGNAYGISPAWLLLGDSGRDKRGTLRLAKHRHNCIDNIQSVALLLKSDPKNIGLINLLDDCVVSLRVEAEVYD